MRIYGLPQMYIKSVIIVSNQMLIAFGLVTDYADVAVSDH